jgi:hypothetical protein
VKKPGRIVSQRWFTRFRNVGSRELRFDRIWRWCLAHRVGLILGLGVFFRVAQYLANRYPWFDESSLAANLELGSPLELLGPLQSTQLAPPGFLLVEWAARRALGASFFSLRLWPLVGGVASVFLFHQVARRCLQPTAALLALALFATSDDLIYFASEFKQYSTDVTFALACTLAGLVSIDRPASRGNLLALAVVGVVALWFSHTAAFVLAGVGGTLIALAICRREARRLIGLVLVGVVWLVVFAIVHWIAMRQLHGDRHGMLAFWGFAFPPIPPRSLVDAFWWPRRLAYLFVNPLEFHRPFGWVIAIIPVLVYALVGFVRLPRAGWDRFGIVVLPLVVTMIVTSLGLYPFHGRLVLFLVPSLLILIAAGACAIGEWAGRRSVWAIIVASVLLLPTLSDVYHVFAPRNRGFFNRFGDRDNFLIDPIRFPSQGDSWQGLRR